VDNPSLRCRAIPVRHPCAILSVPFSFTTTPAFSTRKGPDGLGGYLYKFLSLPPLAYWKTIPAYRFLIACLVISILLKLSAPGTAQSTVEVTDQSTIFTPITKQAKQNTAAWPDLDPRQTSPTRKTVFEQTDSGPIIFDAPDTPGENSISIFENSAECCPQCGRPLGHPILGACNYCTGPVRRLLNSLCPQNVCGNFLGLSACREPWINRPFSAGVFIGPIVGSPLIDDWVGQQTGTLAGMRLGWDMDDDWGMEMRFASATIPLYDGPAAIEAQQLQEPDQLQDLRLQGTRNADHFLWDIDLLYYPWGDAACRPYLLFGLGTTRIKFVDRLSTNYARILAGMPVGIGVKSRLNDWLVFRLECTDNIAFAGGSIFQTQHNASLTGALEVRLGRPRNSYWPWNPGR